MRVYYWAAKKAECLAVSLAEMMDAHSVGNWVGLWVVNSAAMTAASMADSTAAL